MTISMRSELIPVVVEVALFGVLTFLYWLLVVRVIKRERAARKSPFTKALLRGPGESCLQKLDELNDGHWVCNDN